MSDSALTYIQPAFKLLKEHYQLVLLPLLAGLSGSMIDTFSSEFQSSLSILITFFVFFIMPAIYGRVNEIVSKSGFVSWKYLFNKYFLKYLGIVIAIGLIMCIPYFLLSILMISIEASRFPKMIMAFNLFIYQLIGLYSVPLLFYDNTIKQSLSLGFKCLIGNLQYNSPVILLLIFMAFFNIPYAKSDYQILNILFHYIRWSVLFITDFIIFITITLILKDKIYSA